MSPDISRKDSARYSRTVPKTGILSDGSLYELPTPERLTSERESISSSSRGKNLPTPMAADARLPGGERKSPGLAQSAAQGLLPTPVAQMSGNPPEVHLQKKPGRTQVTDLKIIVENGLLETGGKLLPTPMTNDSRGTWEGRQGTPNLKSIVSGLHNTEVGWGPYESRVRLWEEVLGRPAPNPTEPNRNGKPRLTTAFDEWMMGIPEGRVSDADIPYGAKIKLCGNGVVPQQALLALEVLFHPSNLTTSDQPG